MRSSPGFLAALLSVLALGGIALTPSAQSAEPVHTEIYYSGTANILNLMTGAQSTEAVIMDRIVDEATSTIAELACVQDPGKPAEASPVYMRVEGAVLKIADTADVDHPHSLAGTGTVAGQAWAWNHLTFSMNGFGAHIDDYNYLVANMIVGRKQISLPDGTPLELYDINMSEMTATAYQTAFAAMACPSMLAGQ
jgi:hypothetical protein